MSFDVFMIAVVVGGLALSAAYLSAEYRSWREHRATQSRRDAALRELHAASFSEQHESQLPSVVKLQGFGDGAAANPDTGSGASTVARMVPTSYALGERRKRARQRATPA